MDKVTELEAYMKECKSYENDSTKYSLYVHGWWLPHLEKMKKEGLLKEGKSEELKLI